MSLKRILLAALLVLACLPSASAPRPAGIVAWYNGDWQTGMPGLWNWYGAPEKFARVYDQFQVPDGGWTIVGIFSDNRLMTGNPIIRRASWEIRRGMAPGNGGDLVASGISSAAKMEDPSVYAPEYPLLEAKRHFRLQVGNLHIQLPAGQYWLSVTPVGQGVATASATRGTRAVGLGPDGLGMAFFDDSIAANRFVPAEAIGNGGQKGIAGSFSQGIIVAK